MLYIYMFKNKINDKVYIGQTNDIEKRKRGHKSVMNNPKAHEYNDAFHSALRKYGWENFSFTILEEIPDEYGREFLNQREKDFIQIFHSRTFENGYNIAEGGNGCAKEPLTFEQRCALSQVLSELDIRDIQSMLQDDYATFEILRKYPKLSQSLLNNINIGYNFKRDDLSYPLSKHSSKKFALSTRQSIIKEIRNGISYSAIADKYLISIASISNINNGKQWYDKTQHYPLCRKDCAAGAYVHELKHDIIFTTISFKDLANKYGKSESCIKAIAQGRNRRDGRFKYPLRFNSKENQQIWSTLF